MYRIPYVEIAAALDFPKKQVNVCYIRPRFVKNYDKQLKSWKDECRKYLLKKYAGNWFGFMSLLYHKSFNGLREAPCLTADAKYLLSWLQDITNSWAYRQISYPISREILESIIKYRYNRSNLRYRSSARSDVKSELKLSPIVQPLQDSFNVLSEHMYKVQVFCDIYSDWINRFNEEVRSILRSHPHLFKSKEELLYGSLLSKSLQQTKEYNND